MKKFLLLAAAVVVMPTVACAEMEAVSVSEAINLALKQNHLLKAASHERDAAKEDLSVSRSRYLPRIYLDENAAISNAPTRTFMMKLDQGRFTQNDFQIDNLNHPKAHGDFRTAFTLEQPLFDFSIGRGVEMAEKEDTARAFALEQRRQEVAFRVYKAYLDVQTAKGYLSAAEQAVKDAGEHLRLARLRNEAGLGLKSDELRARTYLSEAEQRSISAGNDLVLARMRLSQVTGGAVGTALDTREDITAPVAERSETDLVQLAMENRQDLKEAEAGVAKADAGVRMARSSYLPTVYGTAAYQMNDHDIPFGRDNDAWIVGANLRWELFDGLRRSAEVGKARAMQQSAAEYLENYRKEVALQVEESYLRREEAAKRLEVARNSVRDSAEGARLISRRFENALATMVELLDAQTAVDRARAEMIENESNYALATARLYSAAGVFMKEVVK